MKYFLALLPPKESIILAKWLLPEKSYLSLNTPLFEYEYQGSVHSFLSPIEGTLRVFLQREGTPLNLQEGVAVFEVTQAEQQRAVEQKLGIAITPEEFKHGMSYAEAASIRMPS